MGGDAPVDDIRSPDEVAHQIFGWYELRAGQREAIEAVIFGRDTLAVMPTGYGKSAIYQVAAVMLAGPTVVVSPLISLQADQVASIEAADDAPAAVAVNSGQGERDNRDSWNAVARHGAEFLFLSPEQLAKDEVVERLKRIDVSLFVVDEAHCVSAWGHDFRPDYLRLGEVIASLGHPTTVALTATGSPPVRAEIVERLHMRDPLVLTRGFDRPNLRLEVRRHGSDADKRRAVVEQVAQLPMPGLLYVSTRKDTERYADELAEHGLRTAGYHGGLRGSLRTEVHEALLEDALDVVVATSAFGMGIDKPNVRFVVHASVTDSIDSYYQEIGRAGRDGEPAVATLHYRPEDLGMRRFFTSRSPDEDALTDVYETIAAQGPMRAAELSRRTGVSTRKLTNLVNLLETAGVVVSGRGGYRVHRAIATDAAVSRAVEAAQARQRIDRSRIEMMRGYAETLDCRRQTLLGYFGELFEGPCGNCDVCLAAAERAEGAASAGGDAVGGGAAGGDVGGRVTSGVNGAPEGGAASGNPAAGVGAHTVGDAAGSVDEVDAGGEFAVETRVTHAEWGEGVVMRHENDRITVFFEQEGYKVLSLGVIGETGVLRAEHRA